MTIGARVQQPAIQVSDAALLRPSAVSLALSKSCAELSFQQQHFAKTEKRVRQWDYCNAGDWRAGTKSLLGLSHGNGQTLNLTGGLRDSIALGPAKAPDSASQPSKKADDSMAPQGDTQGILEFVESPSVGAGGCGVAWVNGAWSQVASSSTPHKAEFDEMKVEARIVNANDDRKPKLANAKPDRKAQLANASDDEVITLVPESSVDGGGRQRSGSAVGSWAAQLEKNGLSSRPVSAARRPRRPSASSVSSLTSTTLAAKGCASPSAGARSSDGLRRSISSGAIQAASQDGFERLTQVQGFQRAVTCPTGSATSARSVASSKLQAARPQSASQMRNPAAGIAAQRTPSRSRGGLAGRRSYSCTHLASPSQLQATLKLPLS